MESQFITGSSFKSGPSSGSGSGRSETSTSRLPHGAGPKLVNTGHRQLVRVPKNNILGPNDNDDVWAYFISLNASCPSITLQKLSTRDETHDKPGTQTSGDLLHFKTSRVPLAGGFVIGRDL